MTLSRRKKGTEHRRIIVDLGGKKMSLISGIIAYPLGYLMKGCYWLVTEILHLPLSYVAALFLFTLLTKILMFPISVKQHKATATMSAFNPMIEDLRTRYKNDQNKLNEELGKLQMDYGYSPTAGCAPMAVNLLIMFGLVEVIYKPLTYMLTLPKALISSLSAKTIELMAAAGTTVNANDRMVETYIIGQVKSNFAAFSEFTAEYGSELAKIKDLDMSIGSINLYSKPELALSLALLIPLFSIVTQIISSVFMMKSSGSMSGNAAGQMRTTVISTSILFAVFSFMYPLGFSLYWGFSNLLSLLQSVILNKLYDPEKLKEELLEKIKQKKKEKNARKKVSVVDKATGEVTEKEVSASEADRIRLQRAREIDKERYGDE